MSILTKKALLLNFTADSYHWGCFGTSLEIYHTLLEKGYYVDTVGVDVTHSLTPSPTNTKEFVDINFIKKFTQLNTWIVNKIRCADIVVVNGEGTLHGMHAGPVNLLFLMYLSKIIFKKETHLINHSCFPSSPDGRHAEIINTLYKTVIGCLDGVVSREVLTKAHYDSMGVDSELGFDSLPRYLKRLNVLSTHNPQGYLLLSGGIALSKSHAGYMLEHIRAVNALGYPVKFISGAKYANAPEDSSFFDFLCDAGEIEYVEADTFIEWIDIIRGANFFLSGRFHHTVASIALGVPFAVFSSNTKKIEGMLKTLSIENAIFCEKNNDFKELNETILESFNTLKTNKSIEMESLLIQLTEINYSNIKQI